MGRQSKGYKQVNFGKGKVTPGQIAFIVDRYLSDNNYTKTLSVFRTEASNLLPKTRGKQAPEGLLSLSAILDGYICMKEQKQTVDNEKGRVERLLQGIQDSVNAYNSAGSVTPMVITAPIPQIGLTNWSNAAHNQICHTAASTPHMSPSNAPDSTHSSTSTSIPSCTNKRKGSKAVSDASLSMKKPCAVFPATSSCAGSMVSETNNSSINQADLELSHIQSSHYDPQNRNSVQGSSVARNLFQQLPMPKVVSPGPMTPSQLLPSQHEESVSPLDSATMCNSSATGTPEIIPNNCRVISSKTVIVSPSKNIPISSSPMAWTPNSSNKREHIKGKLDFNDCDASICSERPIAEEISCPATNNENVDIFTDPNFDIFCSDISLSELLVDIDLHGEGTGLSSVPALEPSFDFISGSDSRLLNEGTNTNRDSSNPMSSVTVLPPNGIQKGSDSVFQVKSITKCTQVASPAKNRNFSMEQLN